MPSTDGPARSPISDLTVSPRPSVQAGGAALALSAIVGGVTGGASIAAAGVWIASVKAMSAAQLGESRNLVLLCTGSGLVISWLVAWSLSPGLESWRRAAIGVTAGFGALVASTGALLSLIVSGKLASVLIPAYLALLVVICYGCVRVSRRNRQPGTSQDQSS